MHFLSLLLLFKFLKVLLPALLVTVKYTAVLSAKSLTCEFMFSGRRRKTTIQAQLGDPVLDAHTKERRHFMKKKAVCRFYP